MTRLDDGEEIGDLVLPAQTVCADLVEATPVLQKIQLNVDMLGALGVGWMARQGPVLQCCRRAVRCR